MPPGFAPFFTSRPFFSRPGARLPHDFFLSGGVTRTSSSAVISGHLARTVPSGPDLRRTPVRQGFAAFVTSSATGGGTR
ncbi:hypothetical protein DIE14_14230 [Burkholderia sp. Bp9017]|nr:hypothetical protein DIE14_14230 [Burkholderia sp. Bp9017]RQZ34196.1 hypothetical protein DIE13_14140 [Burkholderia sp. Bp9016]